MVPRAHDLRVRGGTARGIHDPKTDAIQRHTVFAGYVISIGSDRYCIESVEPGKSSPGWVSFRRLK